MSLIKLCRKKLLERTEPIENAVSKVIILDENTAKFLSPFYGKPEITHGAHFTHVEWLSSKRQPFPDSVAIYFVEPTEESIQKIMEDCFKKMYKKVHLYYTHTCSENLTKMLSALPVTYIEVAKELYISFRPYGDFVFSLEIPDMFDNYYSPEREINLERVAEQIATLCETLDENPEIRYYSSSIWRYNNENLAQLVKDKLKYYKNKNNLQNDVPECAREVKSKSQLLIIDREFDLISPLMQCDTFKAITRDFLGPENHTYEYEVSDGVRKHVIIDDENLWGDLEYQHIDDAAEITSEAYRKFQEKYSSWLPADLKERNKVGSLLKNIPPKDLEAVRKDVVRFWLTKICKAHYDEYMQDLCSCEQDLVTETDVKEAKLTSLFLSHRSYSKLDKLRLSAQFILSSDVFNQECMDKIMRLTNLVEEDFNPISNLRYLGVNIFKEEDESNQCDMLLPTRKKKKNGKWVPVIKDIIKLAVKDKLSDQFFPDLEGRRRPTPSIPGRALYDIFTEKNRETPQDVPCLIVFVVGGLSHYEMKCVYEMRKKMNKYKIFIGSTHINTPEGFMNDLDSLA